ncbi:MAG: hypothetical protein ACHWZW_13100 [Spirulina sp.]
MLLIPELERVNHWASVHSPLHSHRSAKRERQSVTHFAPLFLTESNVGEHGFQPPVVSGSALVGDGKENGLRKDLEVGNCLPGLGEPLTAEGYNALLEQYRGSPLTGCTTVMDMARIKAGYNPLSPDFDGNKSAFDDYVSRIMQSPFFFLDYSSRTDYHKEEQNWDQAISGIADLYEGIESGSKDSIVKSLAAMAQAAASRKNTKNTQNLFAQSTISINDKIEVFIYSSLVEMEESQSKGSDSKQTDMTIIKAKLTFYSTMWPSYAQMVLGHHIKLTSDWLDENTLKSGSETTNLNLGQNKA